MHGFIINMTNYLPYFFEFNPQEVTTGKQINYFYAPNIGNSDKQAFYTGSENESTTFSLEIIDMENPFGVINDVNYFRMLREPSPEWSNIFDVGGSYPPAKVLYSFGTGNLVPQVYIVESINIITSLFKEGNISSMLGIPKRANIDITLALDENNIFNKANKYAMKISAMVGSATSITREMLNIVRGNRREQQGIFSATAKF